MIATRNIVNGVNLTAVHEVAEATKTNPANGIAGFAVKTVWKGGTRTETHVDKWMLGGKTLPKHYRIQTDEPTELGGTNTHANPQEYLMAAFNACMMVGYVAAASMKGIELDCVEIETDGELDLRGFFGMGDVKPGYDELHYTVRIKGNGTKEQFREIHETVIATSPNRWNIANPIKLTSDLVVE
jgi:uncharacterized OsmC-like protein